jgi:putative addiction module component (TIGR02574 family)
MSTDELFAQVLRLPRQERARLAEELLVSLEDADDEAVAAAWACELERRSREVAEGKVQTVEWGVARAEILAELEERRARRATS